MRCAECGRANKAGGTVLIVGQNDQGEDQGVPVGKEEGGSEIQDGHPSIERTQCDRRQIVHVDGVMDDTSVWWRYDVEVSGLPLCSA